MDEVFIGQVMLFAGNFVPVGYVACDGQTLSIDDFQILYSLLGTHYGGDGSTTFCVPDLRGRIPIGAGQGAALTPRILGETGGEAAVTLAVANLPSHSHTLFGINSTATRAVPGQSTMFGNGIDGDIMPYNDVMLAMGMIGSFSDKSITLSDGPGTAHENRMPGVGLQYIMAVDGVYPTA
jgi:microcystin-dependent protein